MPTQRSSWVYVDLSPQVAVANTNWLVAKPAPVTGTIKEVWLGINTLLTTGGGIVAVSKNSLNILSATNVDLQADLTAATPESQTLAANAATLRVVAGTDMLKAAWTLTTAAITNAASCIIAIEPDLW